MIKSIIAIMLISVLFLMLVGCGIVMTSPGVSSTQTEPPSKIPTETATAFPKETPKNTPPGSPTSSQTLAPTVSPTLVPTASPIPSPSATPVNNQDMQYKYDVYKRDETSADSDEYGNIDKSTVIAHVAAVGNKQDGVDEYTVQQCKDGTTYVVDIIAAQNSGGDNAFDYTMQLSDSKGTVLQTILHISTLCGFDTFPGSDGYYAVYFIDVNGDGYADMQVYIGGTMNEVHDWYTWDSTSQTFQKIALSGTDMLSFVTIYNDHIENVIRESASSGIVQRLVWQGNTLVKVSEKSSNSSDTGG